MLWNVPTSDGLNMFFILIWQPLNWIYSETETQKNVPENRLKFTSFLLVPLVSGYHVYSQTNSSVISPLHMTRLSTYHIHLIVPCLPDFFFLPLPLFVITFTWIPFHRQSPLHDSSCHNLVQNVRYADHHVTQYSLTF